MTFQLMCVHAYVIFSSIWFAEWSPFGNELLTRLTICSLCIFLLFVVIVISRFGFEGWILVLIASVPGLCTLFYFSLTKNIQASS